MSSLICYGDSSVISHSMSFACSIWDHDEMRKLGQEEFENLHPGKNKMKPKAMEVWFT